MFCGTTPTHNPTWFFRSQPDSLTWNPFSGCRASFTNSHGRWEMGSLSVPARDLECQESNRCADSKWDGRFQVSKTTSGEGSPEWGKKWTTRLRGLGRWNPEAYLWLTHRRWVETWEIEIGYICLSKEKNRDNIYRDMYIDVRIPKYTDCTEGSIQTLTKGQIFCLGLGGVG